MFVVERLGVRYHKVVGVRRVKVAPKNNQPKTIGDTCSHNFICVSSNMTTKHVKQTSIYRTNCETDQTNTEENSGEISIFSYKWHLRKICFANIVV